MADTQERAKIVDNELMEARRATAIGTRTICDVNYGDLDQQLAVVKIAYEATLERPMAKLTKAREELSLKKNEYENDLAILRDQFEKATRPKGTAPAPVASAPTGAAAVGQPQEAPGATAPSVPRPIQQLLNTIQEFISDSDKEFESF